MRYWILGILLALLPSCRKGEVPATTPPEQPDTGDTGVEVRFSAGVTASAEELTSVSRAPFEEYIPRGSQIGVFGIPATIRTASDYTLNGALVGGAQNNLDNALYTVNSDEGNMTQDNEAKYPDADSGSNGLVFYGYYPYTSSLELTTPDFSEYIMPTVLEKDNMETTTDYLFTGAVPQVVTLNSVNLKFQHALGRLLFKVSNSNPGIVATIDRITVLAACSPKGYMNVTTGEIKPESTVQNTYHYLLNNQVLPDEENALVADFMLYPQVSVNLIYVTISTSDGAKSYMIYNKNTATKKIVPEQGKVYVFNVSFSPKTVAVSNTIESWETQGETSATIDEESGEVDVTK